MADMLNSIEGVTVLREIECVVDPDLGKFVVTFAIVFAVASLIFGVFSICILLSNDSSGGICFLFSWLSIIVVMMVIEKIEEKVQPLPLTGIPWIAMKIAFYGAIACMAIYVLIIFVALIASSKKNFFCIVLCIFPIALAVLPYLAFTKVNGFSEDTVENAIFRTKYEIMLATDADRVSLNERFGVVEENRLTLIVEPKDETLIFSTFGLH